jgi:hypothetical protein
MNDTEDKMVALYIFKGYKGEKIINKIRRVLRNRRYLKTAKRLGLILIWHNCKICNTTVEVYRFPVWAAYYWGRQNPIGLCEKCICEKEPEILQLLKNGEA